MIKRINKTNLLPIFYGVTKRRLSTIAQQNGMRNRQVVTEYNAYLTLNTSVSIVKAISLRRLFLADDLSHETIGPA